MTVRANAVAQLPRHLYRRRKDGGKDLVKRDPRQRMINLRANKRTSHFEFEIDMMFQELMYGNSFAWIERDYKFKPHSWWALRSKNMEVAWSKELDDVVYRYSMPGSNETVILRSWDVHHRRGPSLDGILGLSPFELGLNAFALGISMQEYMAKFMENDATPRGLLTHKAKLEQKTKDDIREAWKKRHGGPQNAGEIGILDMELDFKQIGVDNNVLQYVETFGQQRELVCDWFNLQQHMAGILTESTNNNIEQQYREFIGQTLNPDLRSKEERMNIDLLFDDELDDLFIEHRVEALMKGDFAEQNETMTKEILAGVKSPNEVRAWKNLNPVEGGDFHFFPMAYGRLTEEGLEPPKQPETGEDPQDQPDTDINQDVNAQKGALKDKKPRKRAEFRDFSPVLEDACRRIVGREVAAMSKEIARAKTPKDVFDFAESFYPGQVEHAERVLSPVLDTVRAVTGDFLRSEQVDVINQVLVSYRANTQKQLVEQPALAQMATTCESWKASKAEQLMTDIFSALEGVAQ